MTPTPWLTNWWMYFFRHCWQKASVMLLGVHSTKTMRAMLQSCVIPATLDKQKIAKPMSLEHLQAGGAWWGDFNTPDVKPTGSATVVFDTLSYSAGPLPEQFLVHFDAWLVGWFFKIWSKKIATFTRAKLMNPWTSELGRATVHLQPA